MDFKSFHTQVLLFLMLAATFSTQAFAQNDDKDFTISTIDKITLSRISGKSYKKDCPTPLDDLRYLKVLYYDFNGKISTGELICNKSIAQDLIEIFRELYKAKYPIQRIRLVDYYNADDQLSMRDNNTSCFNYRKISGTSTISKHGQGMAIDINPLYNPYIQLRNGKQHIEPKEGKPYADRKKTFAHKIDRNDLCYKLFIEHGFKWGGAWRYSKDYQHFEK